MEIKTVEDELKRAQNDREKAFADRRWEDYKEACGYVSGLSFSLGVMLAKKRISEIHPGAFCEACGKQATERECSCGECSKCGGTIKDESELV